MEIYKSIGNRSALFVKIVKNTEYFIGQADIVLAVINSSLPYPLLAARGRSGSVCDEASNAVYRIIFCVVYLKLAYTHLKKLSNYSQLI